MIEFLSFLRTFVFAVIFGGMEYRYVNRREGKWTYEVDGFYEKPAFWLISPYQAYFLLPAFVVVAFAPSVSAWAANTFLVATLEDVAYFLWRGEWVKSGEWTTLLFGSVTVADRVVPLWWPLAIALSVACYLMPL
ncbi:MAG: hypothetical protein LYZ70_01925 [Nitrososphaerales archaeon]|nr:hypothetical protein [Nitrososphaerales archaeon]